LFLQWDVSPSIYEASESKERDIVSGVLSWDEAPITQRENKAIPYLNHTLHLKIKSLEKKSSEAMSVGV